MLASQNAKIKGGLVFFPNPTRALRERLPLSSIKERDYNQNKKRKDVY